MDHHILASKDDFLKENIVQILDHRPVDISFKRNEKMHQVAIQEVGSCSTIIAQEIFKHNEKLLNEKIAILIYCKYNFMFISSLQHIAFFRYNGL